jgi:hypothetical protein
MSCGGLCNRERDGGRLCDKERGGLCEGFVLIKLLWMIISNNAESPKMSVLWYVKGNSPTRLLK